MPSVEGDTVDFYETIHSAQKRSVDTYDEIFAKVADIAGRMSSVTYLMVTITIFVIVVLVSYAGLALYSLIKKKSHLEAPTQIVIKGKGEKKRKSGRSRKNSRSSSKSSRSSRKSSRSQKSASTRSSSTKTQRSYPSKEVMVSVEIDKDAKKKEKNELPPTVNFPINAPPSYEASTKEASEKSQKTTASEASQKTSEAKPETSAKPPKDTISVSLDKVTQPLTSPAAAILPASTSTPLAKGN